MSRIFARSIHKLASARVRENEKFKSSYRDAENRHNRRADHPRQPNVLLDPRLWYWDLSKQFNPYHVRSRSEYYSQRIEVALSESRYKPHPPALVLVPKRSGDPRKISIYSVVDEALSGHVYRSLINKNNPIFSGRSYAYRPGLTTFDAVRNIQSYWKDSSRIFIAEYDFKSFFDSLDHSYIYSAFQDLDLHATAKEMAVIKAFLGETTSHTQTGSIDESRKAGRGIPQGTSLSLFLSNVALTKLDRGLESSGSSFARYADDLVVWSSSYESIARAVEMIQRWSAEAGVQINSSKSPGIRILRQHESDPAEFSATSSVTFLGHRLGINETDLSEQALSSIKSRVNRIIYENLLREPLRNNQNLNRISSGTDRDYVTAIWQIRRLLYGSLSESQVRRWGTSSHIPSRAFSGAIAIYPWVSNTKSLEALDSYIISALHMALRKRQKLLALPDGVNRCPQPWGTSGAALVDLKIASATKEGGQKIDLRIPSAVRMHRVIKKAVSLHGPSVVLGGHKMGTSDGVNTV